LKRRISEKSRYDLEKAIEDKFMNGKACPMKCPPSHIVEGAGNGERLSEEDENAKGYAFSWGQLLEIERDETVTWEIRFEKLHRDFLDVNKSSRELSDRFLDSIGCLNVPEFLLFKKGTLRGSSASIILTDSKKEKLARKYLISIFARGNGSQMISLVRSIRRAIKSEKPS
jgi:hypothetical protein